ncbi:FixH family protein [Catalinimonas niigatensis]|uniref:FixH family protein n=1 Tax=Catalinimonas niigatensis TaxID=1397264 RepID=UPI0026663934|nr:FixH family protein [Catalinimonas niigatensis]WPP52090.1 FixH family protein [Catalinimonas niigatensis]
MNWGYKITFAFTAFVVFILFMVFKSFQQNVDLVADDYYKQEIEYQQRIDKINNTNTLSQAVSFVQENQQLIVQFPEESKKLEGEINLFRPSDARFDVSTQITLDEHQRQSIPTADIAKGYYKLKVDWKDGDKAYYHETSVFIR